MLARLICFLLGHSFNEFEIYECPQPHVQIRRARCARCDSLFLEVRDLYEDHYG